LKTHNIKTLRTEHLTLLDSYQYDDGVDNGTDAFSREPFGVLFQSSHTGGIYYLYLMFYQNSSQIFLFLSY